ncbi:MAG: MMPL family transporter [Acidimicrobiales bacterium]
MTLAPPRSSTTASSSPSAVPASVLGRLAALVLRHRRIVMGIWLVLLVLGGTAAGQVSKRLSFDFSLPGQPGYETASKIIGIWGNGGDQPPSILVVTAPAGQTISGDSAAVGSAFAGAARSEPSLRVVDYATTGDRAFFTNNGWSTFALVFTPPVNNFGSGKQVQAAQTMLQHDLTGYQVGLTGLNQLSTGGDTKGPGVLVETIIGGLGALVVLAFVFASFLAFLPLLVAAVSITTTFLVVLGLTYMTQVSFIVEFLIALVGLGIAIDYSLLLVTRWREERARGADNHTAVITATETAGRAVFLSGLTVAIGLAALVVLPVPGLRSVGIGGMLIPLVSILVVLTLLPALLGGIGPRIDWPRIRKEQSASRAWSAWGRGVIRWRWAAAGAAIILLALFASPIFQLKVGETGVNSLAKSGAAFDSYQQLTSGGVAQGVLSPIEVLTTNAAAPAARSAIAELPGITTAVLPTGSAGSRHGLTDIVVIPQSATLNNTTLAPVRAVENSVTHMPGVIGVTGLGAVEQDYSHAVFGNFPLMFALIAIVTFVLLARAFRSLLLAGKAIVLNLLSLTATFGLMTWFWQEGHGSNAIFGIPATGAITFWVPLMVFAFLFGLSMDYEVFILTRVREEYDRTGNTNAAVTEGLGRTGRLVTSAALILFLAFASLASAPDTDVKVLATGLGAGILLDATVVRALLVPALVSLFGKWNWWFPRWASRALAVRTDPRQ